MRQVPDHQEAIDLLGDVLQMMGDTPNAGRYWMLSARSDDAAEQARAAFVSRFVDQTVALARTPPRLAAPDAYPAVVRARFVEAGLQKWPNELRSQRARTAGDGYKTRWRDEAAAVVFIGALLIGTVGIWAVGVVYLITRILGIVVSWSDVLANGASNWMSRET